MQDNKSLTLVKPTDAADIVAPTAQYATFFVAGRLYGIGATFVQEVVRSMPVTRVPLAPTHILGLINLRGQVATAIGLRELFGLPAGKHDQSMNVVCQTNGVLLSLAVDDIGDVLEVRQSDFESTPTTIDERVRQFLQGIYKVENGLLSVLDLAPIGAYLGLSRKHTHDEAA